ncbi:hypothetical protein THII_2040 [Thioploca ingrica]|uniref:Uncharacterized protein n=1 Tax=Thioploca ingrica TaxID=40754 RepID=A0A090AKY0_9GAMM|nr:hypothetical protein THII_2040 [Thioploca ingrica]
MLAKQSWQSSKQNEIAKTNNPRSQKISGRTLPLSAPTVAENQPSLTLSRTIATIQRRDDTGNRPVREFFTLQRKLSVGAAGDVYEREAERVVQGMQPSFTHPLTMPMIQRRAAPYIKKITVHLTPPQSADLEWRGTPPAGATGSDHFTVSTGKGYSNPGDPPGTCTRNCCRDPMTQCAPPWNQPTRVGACCTYYGNHFWTGTPLPEHNGWKWWTPIQPYYSTRGIALHQHDEVTGQPIGHGCVRMEELNAKRIYDFSNGRDTNVTIDGRAAPVACDADRQCSATRSTRSDSSARTELNQGLGEGQITTEFQEAATGLEGIMS